MYELQTKVAQEFKLDINDLILSMGTSADFEEAVN